MAEIITVARPYAEAVFRLAKDANRLAPWGEALAVLAAMMEHSEVVTLVTNPKSTAQEVGKLIVDVLGDRADVEVKNFIDALQENHRLTLLPEIARQFELLKSREESVVEATVESAFAAQRPTGPGACRHAQSEVRQGCPPVNERRPRPDRWGADQGGRRCH